jgi:hypothetical protein
MSGEIKAIINAIVTAVEAFTPTSDTGSPTKFRNLKKAQIDGGLDGWFVVEFTGGNRESIGGIAGKKQAHVDVILRLSLMNEGRSVTEFSALVAENTARLQDYVPEHIRQSVVITAGFVRNVYTLNDSSVEWSAENPRRVFVNIPLRIVYYGDHISP